jgi:hypothetical protein
MHAARRLADGSYQSVKHKTVLHIHPHSVTPPPPPPPPVFCRRPTTIKGPACNAADHTRADTNGPPSGVAGAVGST